MLVDFQTALADLTASPAFCRQVRSTPEVLHQRYDLTDKEWRRLVGVVDSKGMEANCMLYRANRLAPVALNLPETCTALGERLTELISAYWDFEPITNVHFLIEADRFCRFLAEQPDLSDAVWTALGKEHATVADKLAASRAWAGVTPEASSPGRQARQPSGTLAPGKSMSPAWPVRSDRG